MKILVTGVAGFLGSHLADALIEQGHDVYGIDNLSGGYLENIPKSLVSRGYWASTDLNNDYAMADVFTRDFEVIYHCACNPYEGLSVFSPSLVTKNTFGNTVSLLSQAIASGKLKRFIYMSSMSRYGKLPAPFYEDMKPAPEDPYAVAKVASEQVVAQMAETHGFEYAIAVPHSIIGPRQKYDDPFRNVASIMINRMLQGKPPVIYGDGKQTRCFSFVGDCIPTLLKLMDCPSGETYNIGPDQVDGEVVTIFELADVIAELTGFKGKYEFFPDRPREVKHAHCSSEKIRMDFDYKTKTTLREGLRLMVDDIKKKGTKPFDYRLPIEIVNHKTPRTWTQKLI